MDEKRPSEDRQPGKEPAESRESREQLLAEARRRFLARGAAIAPVIVTLRAEPVAFGGMGGGGGPTPSEKASALAQGGKRSF